MGAKNKLADNERKTGAAPAEQAPQDHHHGSPALRPDAGPPKWLIYGFIAKMALVILIVLGVFWWSSR